MNGLTPYEAWTKEKPHLGHIRVFGCTAHMRIPNVNLKKLDNRSKPVVYLGKESGVKAFRLYDPDTNTICVSRDVIFEEAKPWKNGEKGTHAVEVGTFTVVMSNAEGINEAENIEGYDQTDPGDLSGTSLLGSNAASSSTADATPTSTRTTSSSDTNGQPLRYRPLTEIYNEAEQVELNEEELYLMGIDEPGNYSEAAKKDE